MSQPKLHKKIVEHPFAIRFCLPFTVDTTDQKCFPTLKCLNLNTGNRSKVLFVALKCFECECKDLFKIRT